MRVLTCDHTESCTKYQMTAVHATEHLKGVINVSIQNLTIIIEFIHVCDASCRELSFDLIDLTD